MSEQNVEAFKRGIDAFNRRDVEALLERSILRWSGIFWWYCGRQGAGVSGTQGPRLVP